MSHMAVSQPCAWTATFERLFSLSAGEREHLQQLTKPVEEIDARRIVTSKGKLCERLLILRSGWMVEFKLLRNGHRQILNFRLPGDLACVECLAYRAALHSTATLTQCTVSPLQFEEFEETQRQFPRLASAFFLMTLRESAILNEWEVTLGKRPALSRVGHLLLELDRRLRARGLAEDDWVQLPLTQEDVADCTGLTTPYVNRVLQTLRSKGLIRFEHRRLEILERAELARMAGFDPAFIDDWGLGKASLSPE
jgi:CRP-like cAMP-binding protein